MMTLSIVFNLRPWCITTPDYTAAAFRQFIMLMNLSSAHLSIASSITLYYFNHCWIQGAMSWVKTRSSVLHIHGCVPIKPPAH